MPEERIGVVLRYWPRAGAAQIELDHSILQVGDTIKIRGRDHEVKQEIRSLEIDHVSKSEGFPGEFLAIAVDAPVREKDEVWIVRPPKVSLIED